MAAIGMGTGAGFAVYGLQKIGLLNNPLKRSGQNSGCGTSAGADPKMKVNWRFWTEKEGRDRFTAQMRVNGLFLGKWMLFAFFLESLMIAYVPAEWIAGAVGHGSTFAIPIAAAIGIPAYMNGYAAVPLISGLMEMGMTPGAAMAFITSGAVSSIPAALAVYALVRKPVFAAYIILGLTGSMLAGFILQISIGT